MSPIDYSAFGLLKRGLFRWHSVLSKIVKKIWNEIIVDDQRNSFLSFKFNKTKILKLRYEHTVQRLQNQWLTLMTAVILHLCTVGQKKKKHSYLFQCKLSNRNEIGTNHPG